MYKIITNSEINILGTLDATFTALFREELTGYSTGANKVDGKPTIYHSGLASFTRAKKSPNAWYFGAHLSPLLENYFSF